MAEQVRSFSDGALEEEPTVELKEATIKGVKVCKHGLYTITWKDTRYEGSIREKPGEVFSIDQGTKTGKISLGFQIGFGDQRGQADVTTIDAASITKITT